MGTASLTLAPRGPTAQKQHSDKKLTRGHGSVSVRSHHHATHSPKRPTRVRHRSPKYSTVRETGIMRDEIHTALIWQRIRPQFGPAHFRSKHLYPFRSNVWCRIHHQSDEVREVHTGLPLIVDFLSYKAEMVQANRAVSWSGEKCIPPLPRFPSQRIEIATTSSTVLDRNFEVEISRALYPPAKECILREP